MGRHLSFWPVASDEMSKRSLGQGPTRAVFLCVATVIAFAALSLMPVAQAQNNNYYWQQQQMRNQQAAMERQRQQQAEQQRRQQAERQRQMQIQQQQMRARQQEMQRQAQQRQQAMMAERQRQMQRQQDLVRQRNQQAVQGQRQSAQQAQVIQQQRALQQQRAAQLRQEQLNRLRQDRERRQGIEKKRQEDARTQSLRMMLAARQQQAAAQNAAARASQDRQRQAQQQQDRTRMAAALQQQRVATQQRMVKLQETQRRMTEAARIKREAAKETATKLAAAKAFKNCSGGVCTCSFDGDTLVLTKGGYAPIKSLAAGKDWVWAKSEHTGESGWKPVTAHYSNLYEETVEIAITGADGRHAQTIKSNRIHPFFVGAATPAILNDGAEPASQAALLAQGKWITAEHLQAGQKLLESDGEWAEVTGITIKPEPLHAFNLTVADFHTYFVRAPNTDAADPVWVHNDCNSGTLSRSAAFRTAKEKAGVPRSQQPISVTRELLRDQPGNVYSRVYRFRREDGSIAIIREHTLGHKKGNLGPHFNSEVRGVDGRKLPLERNADSHTFVGPKS